MEKRVLLIAGAGSIGSHTATELVARGFDVDIITLDKPESKPHITYINEYATLPYYKQLLGEKNYDAIVDFMHYNPDQYDEVLQVLASHTQQLIFLSSYRVYGDAEHPIKETSPKQDEVFAPDDPIFEIDTYPIQKIRCERIIRTSAFSDKVTIVRPVISFYYKTLSFITTKFHTLIERSREHKTILVPEIAKDVVAGLCFSANVGKLLAHLVLNPKAYGEDFTLSTGECKTWGEIATYLHDTFGSKFKWISTEDYLTYGAPPLERERYGLLYDRALNRDMDVSKVMAVTGLKPEDFIDLRSAIQLVATQIPEDISTFPRMPELAEVEKLTDRYLEEMGE